ncbi:MAG: HEPN domain-containing protein [Phycisphaerae bacterium]
MGIKPEEWLKQAVFDIETAEYMFNGGRYFYAVFMCHLAIEKSLKGIFQKRLAEVPPKVHNLVYLLNRIGLQLPETMGRFLIKLNEASVATRYPEDLEKLKSDFTQSTTKDILAKSKEFLEWIKKQ